MSERVAELESTVAELEATVKALTEELVEANERIRVLEASNEEVSELATEPVADAPESTVQDDLSRAAEAAKGEQTESTDNDPEADEIIVA